MLWKRRQFGFDADVEYDTNSRWFQRQDTDKISTQTIQFDLGMKAWEPEPGESNLLPDYSHTHTTFFLKHACVSFWRPGQITSIPPCVRFLGLHSLGRLRDWLRVERRLDRCNNQRV